MPKAKQVLAGLERDGWEQVRMRGSHRFMRKHGMSATFGHHIGSGLGTLQMRQIAKDFGYTLDELRGLSNHVFHGCSTVG